MRRTQLNAPVVVVGSFVLSFCGVTFCFDGEARFLFAAFPRHFHRIILTKFSFECSLKEPTFGNEFRKPIWYDDESDDELFDNNKAFMQVFTNPLEMQKHFERQMHEMLKSLGESEGNSLSPQAWNHLTIG